MESDIWQPVGKVPTQREIEARAAKRKAEAAKPKPIPGKPGFTIDGEGRMSYDPYADLKKQAYKSV